MKEAESMNREPVALTKITITQEERPNRSAYIHPFEDPVLYGVHGGVKQFYGIEPKEERPSTLDHIVAAAGG
jgi:hypothetical protein